MLCIVVAVRDALEAISFVKKFQVRPLIAHFIRSQLCGMLVSETELVIIILGNVFQLESTNPPVASFNCRQNRAALYRVGRSYLDC